MAIRKPGIIALAALFVVLPRLAAWGGETAADREAVHILNRLAFGPSPEDLRHLKAVGIDRWIEEQLAPAAIEEPVELRYQLAALDTLGFDAVRLRQMFGPPRAIRGFKPTIEQETAQRERARIVVREAEEARLQRAILSRRQLQQVMVDFWFNHFNIFAQKGLDHVWIGNYEERAIRPNALGHFRDLLMATAKHPAMLVYLDNATSSAPHGRAGLNENYAREVMELHTLGVDGGYTQDDVITLARALTGWGLNRPDARVWGEYAAVFEGARHDYGPKVFLGRQLEASGKAEGEEALTMLARSPQTAHHIAFELAQYFVADLPPADLVDRLAARFLATDGDIREVLRALFASQEFRDSVGQKYKTPYQFVISAVRAAALPVQSPRPLLAAMDGLGMPLYGCQTPDGYKNTEAAWLSPDATMRRIGFAAALARGGLPLGVSATDETAPAPHPVDAAALAPLLGPALSPHTLEVVAGSPPELRAALLLGSPDFMRR
jgi:uncharacterized protein (DUF1800 family)